MIGTDPKRKYAGPTNFASVKDASLPTEKFLEVKAKEINDAKAAQFMKAMNIKFIPEGADRTLDDNTNYEKTCTVEQCNAQMTVQELREVVAAQQKIDVQDVNFYTRSSIVPHELRLGQCYTDWMGFGMENWPPQLVAKPRIRGFEVIVTFPACRDSSNWDGGKLNVYMDKAFTYDVEPSTSVGELKELVAKSSKIPAHCIAS